ncbi:related to CSR1 - phosphatidylinositol transfer protein [Pseudozyma flocculosa]|uniref:Related to CSR1 - phosphatidylinositol transfer protein n=1 Tax=Pseudozyma flocculosa TaxID=84751 RepID=A0A5C3F8S7_9BASI|nr:related to CSR1 - phosphatidylinositol transfer protein [Pseudozyma flocculosa]
MQPNSSSSAQSDYFSQPGYRGNLTTSQTIALLKLWRRFLRLCETAAPNTAQPNPPNATKHRPLPHSSSSPSLSAPYSASASSSASASGDRLDAKHAPYHAQPDDAAAAAAAIQDGYRHHSRATPPPPAQQQQQQRDGNGHTDSNNLPPQDDKLKDHLRSIEESKDLHAFVATHGGAALKREFWAMVKGEHPDAVMLRFLRARKWNVDRALAVIGSACAFRVQHNVTQLMKNGELGLVRTRGGMNIFRNGISYILGATPNGEPIYTIEVGSHYSSNQTAEELKNAVIFMQECLSLMMPPPVEKKVVIFNLNNFGIRNMDWSIVLFMAKTMESFYPETLARVYVHGAPWIFKPIWSILRPLLDPVVRDKIRLTWKVEELSEHVPVDHLPKKTLHGNLDFEFLFPEPEPGENDVQKDTAAHDALRLAYLDVVTEFENATRALARCYRNSTAAAAAASSLSLSSWSEAPGGQSQRNIGSRRARKLGRRGQGSSGGGGGGRDEFDNGHGNGNGHDDVDNDDDDGDDDGEPEGSASLRAMRDVLATKLRVAWLRLKPYVIGKTKYDRWGVAQDDGTIRWTYKTLAGRVDTQILGEGTSLPALERALAEIEGAHSMPGPLPQPAATSASAAPAAAGHAAPSTANAAPHTRSNLSTAPVVVAPRSSSSLSSSAATTPSQPRDPALVATLAPDAASTDESRRGAKEAEGQSTRGKASIETEPGRFQDIIPIHPSDPAFEKARNADHEVAPS